MEERRSTGIASTYTLIGAGLGALVPATDPVVGGSVYMAGALLGAAIGIAIDVLRNWPPRRSDWQFSLRTLMLAVVAFTILSIGARTYLQLLNLKP